MKLSIYLLCGIAALHAVASIRAADEPLGELNWTNGDQLAGELIDASRTHLKWKAPVFTQPFVIDLNQVRSVRFPVSGEPDPSKEPFRIFMRSGDVVNGKIVELSDKRIVVDSQRHGQVTLDRAKVRSFRRLNDPALIFEGPAGLAGWSTISRSRKATDWKVAPQGMLSTAVVGAELYRDLGLPAVAEIEIKLSWTQKPGFLITFVEPNARRVPKHTVKLETWDDELVMQALASTGDFEQVQTVAPEVKSVQLRLLWDQLSGELTAYSRAGELLSKLKADREQGKNLTCLYIKNKGSDLKLESLRVRSWNGTALSALAEGQSHVHQLDGEFVYGTVKELRGTDLVLTSDQGETTVPLEKISGADFGQSEPDERQDRPVRISFTDGTTISGELQSVSDGQITLKTLYSSEPMTASIDGAFAIAFKKNEQAAPNVPADVLEYRGARLHGQLSPVGKQGRLGWKPIGSTNASPLLSSDPARVIRRVEKANIVDQNKGDMIYLRNGDVIPCHVVSVDEKQVDLKPAFAANTSISRDQVRAIDFGTSGDKVALHFDHPGWTITNKNEGAIDRKPNEAVFNESATLGNQNVFSGNTMLFDVEWTAAEPVSLTVGLRTRAATRPGNLSYKLYFVGDQVHVQGLQGRQGFVYRHRLRNRKANVEMSLRSNRFRLLINGDTALDQVVGSNRRDGQGVVFIAKRERPNGRTTNNLITVSNLRAGNARRAQGSISIEEEHKSQILTVPRNRKKNPPTHILAAQNGDVLRGRLVSMTSEQIKFRSRFSDMAFPRDRVATLVWLDPPQDEEKEAVENVDQPAAGDQKLIHPMQAVLLGGVTFSFSADRMSDDEIIGKHPYLGQCRLPIHQVREVRIGMNATPEAKSPFADWVLTNAPEPLFATAGGADANPAQGQVFGADSPLIGTNVQDFQAKLNDGNTFRLGRHADKVLVLDFWATWCGPCIRAMPEVMEAVAEFPQDQVMLVGINQQETEKTVADFLEAREWDLLVAFDPEGEISKRFQVEAIPQTVVIGPGGKIERLHVGTHNNLREELTKVLAELVGEQPAVEKF